MLLIISSQVELLHGLDNLSAVHLKHCHPIISCILVKLFNLMLRCGYLPIDFGLSCTVPLPKLNDIRTKSMVCSDFRGIAISSILFLLRKMERNIVSIFQT